ncbi:unnamed protein product [Bursaphelenchus okinawaensis]|uniref:Protein kinase domain-containing protein n=1 Tax=Bursaphelenchus okinawaensis TaxID=465554 RepID=A0A811KGQ0_9BILA|nr:unnamed protein product [Bursaphelenchus okinawaensis]CAG9104140.1 unnamed protein product [Bursaphelenchus okinawaensis]
MAEGSLESFPGTSTTYSTNPPEHFGEDINESATIESYDEQRQSWMEKESDSKYFYTNKNSSFFRKTVFAIGNGVPPTPERPESRINSVMTPAMALDTFADCLDSYEKKEIKKCKLVSHVGSAAEKDKLRNYYKKYKSFDDILGRYFILTHDHLYYRYEILKELHVGKMAQVVLTYDHERCKKVVAKIFRNDQWPKICAEKELKVFWAALIKKEGKEMLMELCSKHFICPIYNQFKFRGHNVFIMEQASRTIDYLIKHNVEFSLINICKFARQICDGLQFLHGLGIVHGSICPQHVIHSLDKPGQIRLIDFSYSCIDKECKLPLHFPEGKHNYAAPELLLGHKYGKPVDIWGLACTVAEMITKKMLFKGSVDTEVMTSISSLLGNIAPHLLTTDKTTKGIKRPEQPYFDQSGNFIFEGKQLTRTFLKDVIPEQMFVEPIKGFLKSSLVYNPVRRPTADNAFQSFSMLSTPMSTKRAQSTSVNRNDASKRSVTNSLPDSTTPKRKKPKLEVYCCPSQSKPSAGMDPRANGEEGPGGLVSRILQVALGLFVTTVELPVLSPNDMSNLSINFDCDFSRACRWGSVGHGLSKWKLAKGQPDGLLWLAATGTMALPSDPFAILEIHDSDSDIFTSQRINCQIESAMFSFTYWTIGSADLQICLLDEYMREFNCTGMLESRVQPGKVALKIPAIGRPFHIAIIPDARPGAIVLDDIKYDAEFCKGNTLEQVATRGPLFPRPESVSVDRIVPPTTTSTWIEITTTQYTTTTEATTEPTTTTESTTTTTTEDTTTTATVTTTVTEAPVTISTTPRETIATIEENPEFDLLIIGNKTQPLFDRRRGRLIEDTGDLLCDFAFNFPCFWGPEAGKWAIVEKGAIPSMEERAIEGTDLPAYPAAVVIQGTAMFSSDPLKCQTGSGKLLFRYWANNKLTLQVCALGYNLDSNKIQCVEQDTGTRKDQTALAVFEFSHDILEPFTLNIVPVWEKKVRNAYLVLDEIAYIGECNTTLLESSEVFEKKINNKKKIEKIKKPIVKPLPHQTTVEARPVTSKLGLITPSPAVDNLPEPDRKESESFEEESVEVTEATTEATTLTTTFTTTAIIAPTMNVRPGLVVQKTTSKNSFTIPYTTTPKFVTTTPEPIMDYCKLLNCDFNDNACHYLNHGLTKIPWTLRNKGYGFPLSRHTDLRPTPTNGQFVSAILGPGDFAILESPRFNLTQGINVLLFQYYRPTHASTIRLCLGTRYTKPLRTISSFIQCPPILRSLTSKNAFKWNSVHIQLPPGTSHFYLVAHNLDRSTEKAAIAIDNIRVAICDPRSFDPSIEESTTMETTS